jgi:hypothetical protein
MEVSFSLSAVSLVTATESLSSAADLSSTVRVSGRDALSSA